MVSYSTTLTFLSLFQPCYKTYRQVKKNRNYQIGLAVAVLLFSIVLIALREPYAPWQRIDFDPYETLGVPKDASKLDVRRAYRKLSLTKHPDKVRSTNPNISAEELEKAVQLFLKIQKSQSILLDTKQRENYEKYGTPEDVERLLPEEYFPDFIIAPGRKFVVFYLFLILFFVLVLPISAIVFVPAVREPTDTIRSEVLRRISEAENLLAQNDSNTVTALDSVQQFWISIRTKLPKYKKSIWGPAFEFRIACRKCQYYLINEKIPDRAEKVLDILKGFKNTYSTVGNLLSDKDVQALILNQVKDLKSTINSVSLSANKEKEILDALATATRPAKPKNAEKQK